MKLETMEASASNNLFDILTRQSGQAQGRDFLVREGEAPITFGDMFTESAKVAAWLRKQGFTKGDRLLVQVEKSPAAVALYLGCLRVGAVFVPLNTAYTESEVSYFVEDADPRAVVGSEGLAASTVSYGGLRHLLPKSFADAPWASYQPDADVEPALPNDAAAILYTSGTTGRSKGAVLTHRNLSSNALVLHEAWRWKDGDVLLHALPIYHAHGLFVGLHGALLNASTVLFHERFDAKAVLRDLPRSTVFMGVPTFYTRLLEEKAFDASLCSNMRVFISGSAPLLESTFLDFESRTGHRILERYGMTEAVMITSNPYDGPRKPGTVGRPLADIDVRIIKDGEVPVGVEEPGILQLKGPNLFSGYWRNPAKTTEEHTADGFFVSGDVAVYDQDGFIRIVGREKDLIISGGFNVYPKEIELAIDALPGVIESAVIGVPHPDFGEGVVGVVVAERGATLDPNAIREALSVKLAPFKRPKEILVVHELPRNAMGKVQKAQLRKQHEDLFAAYKTELRA